MLPPIDAATTTPARTGVENASVPAPATDYPPAYPEGSDGPALNAQWLAEGFIPQGQGYDATRDQLLSTYNNGGSVRLALQSSRDGSDLGDVVLGGIDPRNLTDLSDPSIAFNPFDRADPLSAPTKGGGVATDGTFVYVADTDAVYVYRRDAIADAAPGAVVPATNVIAMPNGHNASFLSIRDGRLYVGEFAATTDALQQAVDARVEGVGERVSDLFEAANPFDGGLKDYFGDQFDALNPVDIDVEIERPELLVFDIADAQGQPAGGFDGDAPSARYTIPFDAQGVAITDTGFLFTRSYGSTEFDVGGIRIESPRELVFQPFDGGDARAVAQIDYYAEGLNIVGDEVWITYESNATEYSGKYEDNTGQAPDNDHVQRIPLDSLDISREALGA